MTIQCNQIKDFIKKLTRKLDKTKEPLDCAYLSNHVYNDVKEGGIYTINDRKYTVGKIVDNKETGLYIATYIPINDPTRIFIVNRGTDEWLKDSVTRQAPEAIKFSQEVMKSNPNSKIICTGHSRGGTLAQAQVIQAIELNKQYDKLNNTAVTFNAFGSYYPEPPIKPIQPNIRSALYISPESYIKLLDEYNQQFKDYKEKYKLYEKQLENHKKFLQLGLGKKRLLIIELEEILSAIMVMIILVIQFFILPILISVIL